MLSPNLGNPIPCTERLGEKDYRPVILRMSKESGMLNSMTESSFSLLFSRSSSSCNRKHPAQRGRGTAKGPLSPWKEEMPEQTPNRSSRTISACFTVRGKPSKRKPFLQGGESRLFSISSTTISSLTCREERWVYGQEGHPDFIQLPAELLYSCQCPGCIRPFLQLFLVPQAAATAQGTALNRVKAACSDLPTSGKHSLPWVSTLRRG